MTLVKDRLMGHGSLASAVIGIMPLEPGTDEAETLQKITKDGENHVGTAAIVVQVAGTNWPKPAYSLLVTGLSRFRIKEIVQEKPYPVAAIQQLGKLTLYPDPDNASPQLHKLMEDYKEQALALLDLLDSTSPTVTKLKRMLNSVPAHQLADIISSIVRTSYNERVEVLNAVSLEERFRKALPLLERQIEGLRILQKPKMTDIEPMMKPKRRRNLLNGFNINGMEEDGDDVKELEKRLLAAELPEKAFTVAGKELQRLKKMSPQMPEYPMLRNYLELMADLPWNQSSQETIDIQKAREDLDADHYALNKVKQRILEYLAVRQLKNSLKGPILCFVGPPGVGKTSIGKSIANTLGREFHRISLGGVSDQSDVRGHRRTYIGSMPGRIVQGLRTARKKNPVFLLDEIDKMSSGIHGDPSAALLEVLDPEQNAHFVDHYLNVPFDLSEVLFIATANTLRSIPGPLRDRMEIIQIPGYTQEDKTSIVMRHLLPKQLKLHGIDEKVLKVPDGSVDFIVSKYTREAGVRTLERKIGAICRAVAVKVAEHNKDAIDEKSEDAAGVPALPIVLDEHAIQDILGPPIFESELSGRLGDPGIAVGLAWTAVGGEVMIVEATKMVGGGKLVLTGQLGDVMKESATIALNWIRSRANKLEIPESDSNLMDNMDVHIHFPAGAVGKDGPSAGVTVTTALVSLFTGKVVRKDLAMTGEMTLRGIVLPVGGIKEKVLAAHRAGIKRVILPKKNEKDLNDISAKVKSDMDFVLVQNIEEVLDCAFNEAYPIVMDNKKFQELSKL